MHDIEASTFCIKQKIQDNTISKDEYGNSLLVSVGLVEFLCCGAL
jgi:hypothetical protein